MASTLVFISLLCALLLTCYVPLHCRWRSIPLWSLLAWLFTCNVIQGINSAIWSGNSSFKIPVWCDIASVLLYGAQLALPAACLCLSCDLRPRQQEPGVGKGPRLSVLSCVLCFVAPTIYMAMHIIVQDHRFDITENFGCTASVYASAPALVLVWLPPTMLCIATLVVASFVIYSSLRSPCWDSVEDFNLDCLRPLLTSMSISLFFFVSNVCSLYAGNKTNGALSSWTSWKAVHTQLSMAEVVSQTDRTTLVAIELAWWIIPASTFSLIAMSCVFGSREDVSDSCRVFLSRLRRLLSTGKSRQSSSGMIVNLRPHITLKSTDSLPTTSVHKYIRTGSLHEGPFARARPAPISIPAMPPATPPSSTTSDESDVTFAQSTRSYVDSPIGRAVLGLPAASPPLPRPARAAPLPGYDAALEALSAQIAKAQTDVVPGCSAPSPASILSAAWPRPPTCVPASPASPQSTPRSPSRPPSRQPPGILSRQMSAQSTASTNFSLSAYSEGTEHSLQDSPTLPQFPSRVQQESGIPDRPSPVHPRQRRSQESLLVQVQNAGLCHVRYEDEPRSPSFLSLR
ncbi:STE3-like pheromone receptor protein [Wolfiporia cocos MD-104 SS10]|uniref:STE3-like pheromone receptor protein n=7 Tax=Wolfiporia cocos TaxID=81056 RepID=A0A2H3JM12_WOLCO|nr:STE3-like pheromone receptor protein [Wolfiporia cocos MD-104 SS10]